MNLVIIYGPPAVGKLTVATELAKQTSYKLFHNHYTQDMIFPIFFNKSRFSAYKLLGDIRLSVFEEAIKNNIDIIFTFCFEINTPQIIDFVKQTVEMFNKFMAKSLFVRLYCDLEEQFKRVELPSRKSHSAKLNTAELLNWALQDKDLSSRIDFIGEHLEIDTTLIPVEEVAEKIRLYYVLPSNPSNIDFKYF